MTDEQLEVANRNIEHHTSAFGFSQPNTEFKKGYIERLDELDLADNSFDVIVSNCVINLSPDKDAVLREAYRVLKPGGELYFSDVYSDRRVPQVSLVVCSF
jgi:arsenite methyltransferase